MDFINFFFPEFSLTEWLSSLTKAFQELDISWMDTASIWLLWASLPLLGVGAVYLVCRMVAAVTNRKSEGVSGFLAWLSRYSLSALVIISLGAISLAGSYIMDYTYNPRTVVEVEAE